MAGRSIWPSMSLFRAWAVSVFSRPEAETRYDDPLIWDENVKSDESIAALFTSITMH